MLAVSQSCVHQHCLALAVTGAQLGLVFCEGQDTCDSPTLVWGNTNQISTATRTSPYRGILQVQTTSRALHTMCSKIRIACDAAEDASRGGLTYHCNIGQANFSKPWSREYSSQYTNHYMHRKKVRLALPGISRCPSDCTCVSSSVPDDSIAMNEPYAGNSKPNPRLQQQCDTATDLMVGIRIQRKFDFGHSAMCRAISLTLGPS